MRKTTCQNRQFAMDTGAKLHGRMFRCYRPIRSEFTVCGALPDGHELPTH